LFMLRLDAVLLVKWIIHIYRVLQTFKSLEQLVYILITGMVPRIRKYTSCSKNLIDCNTEHTKDPFCMEYCMKLKNLQHQLQDIRQF